MLTIRNEDGEFEVTHAVYRMPNRPGAKVDNFHAGGLAAKMNSRAEACPLAVEIPNRGFREP